MCVQLLPFGATDETIHDAIFNHLYTRERGGVCQLKPKHVKDIYILPLHPAESIPDALLPFEGPGLSSPKMHIYFLY